MKTHVERKPFKVGNFLLRIKRQLDSLIGFRFLRLLFGLVLLNSSPSVRSKYRAFSTNSVLPQMLQESEDHYESEIFSILSSAHSWTSVIFSGKRDNRHRSATGFSGIVTQTGYRMSVAILRSGEGSIFFNISNHANFSGEKKKRLQWSLMKVNLVLASNISELTQQDGRGKKTANLVWLPWQQFCLK